MGTLRGCGVGDVGWPLLSHCHYMTVWNLSSKRGNVREEIHDLVVGREAKVLIGQVPRVILG